MQQHPRDPQDRPGRTRQEAGRHGRRRRSGGRRAAAAQHRHARRRWTYLGIGTVVAGTVAVAAVAAGTFVLGGTGDDSGGSVAARTVAPVPSLDGGATGTPATTATTGAGIPSAPPSASAAPSASASRAATTPAPTRSASASPAARATTPGKRPAAAPDTATTRADGAEPYRSRATQSGGSGGGGDHISRVIELANAERAKAGCPALRANSLLQKAAQGHADDMAARDYYEHDTPEGLSAGDRIEAAGYRWSTWAENIHRGPGDPATAVRDWMKSPGHRANILNCAFRDIGVGVNMRSNGPWWVQNFGASA
ncbi:CAP domain-containing protein [Streptomyces thermolilacinus]